MLPLRRRLEDPAPGLRPSVLACQDPTSPRTPEPPPDAAVALATFSLTRIATGSTHSCGLDANGLAYCWGFLVAMGDGSSSTSMVVTPVPVAGGHHFVEVRPGTFHTCGLATDGRAWCWARTGAASWATAPSPTG